MTNLFDLADPPHMKHFALTLLLLIASPALAADYSARVVGVSDGDRLIVLKDRKTQVKVRLARIDAPETGQPYGSRAKQAASELAFGKDVTIREVDRDRYGRMVAEVTLPGGRSLKREMVEIGMAWRYEAFAPNDVNLLRAQVCVKKVKLGLWADENPVPPWDWRHGRGVPVTAEVVGKPAVARLPSAALPWSGVDEIGKPD